MLPPKHSALVVAHPGHELRVFGWLHAARPRVFVLTDGSGRTGRSRLPSTTRLLREAGAEPASIYGRLSDHEAYEAMLRTDHAIFVGLAEELAAALIDQGTELVTGDAMEEYNPTHDVCRLIIDAAVELVWRRTSRRVENWEFPLVGPPDSCPTVFRSRAMFLHLEPEMFGRKMAAARRYTALTDEVDEAIQTVGEDVFRVEMLRPAVQSVLPDGPGEEPPYYERHGESRVAAGVYARVLRRREHVLPIAAALWHAARREAEPLADLGSRAVTE